MVILPLENPDLYQHELLTRHLYKPRHFVSISTGSYQGKPVGIMRSKLGGPATAMAIECLIMMGVKEVIGIGYCGALNENISAGEIIVPNKVFPDDHLSIRYGGEKSGIYPDEKLSKSLYSRFESLHLRVRRGSVTSTDTVLLETSSMVQEWAERGSLGIDMESGALFQVARTYSVQCAAALVVSDNAITGIIASNEVLAESYDHAVRAALDVLK